MDREGHLKSICKIKSVSEDSRVDYDREGVRREKTAQRSEGGKRSSYLTPYSLEFGIVLKAMGSGRRILI